MKLSRRKRFFRDRHPIRPHLHRSHKGPRTNNDVWERALKVVQTCAIIGGAIWGLYIYVTFQKRSNELTLAQQQLTAEQQGLANKAAAIGLATQEQLTKLTMDEKGAQLTKDKLDAEQVALSTKQETIELRTFELARTLDIKEKEIALQRSEADLKAQQRRGLQSDCEVKLKSLGHDRYKVEFTMKFENLSKTQIEVSAVIIDSYLGTPSPTVIGDSRMLPVDVPDNRWNQSFSEARGAFNWALVDTHLSLLLAAWHKIGLTPDTAFASRQIDGLPPHFGGYATGQFNTGEKWGFTRGAIITAPADGYVAEIASVALDRVPTNQDVIACWSGSLLSEATPLESEQRSGHSGAFSTGSPAEPSLR